MISGGINDVSTIIRMDILTTGARGVRLITTGARGFRLLKPISMSRYWSFHTQGTQTEDVTLLFTLGAIFLNKHPFVTLSGWQAGRGKAPSKIVGIGDSVLSGPQGTI